MIRHILTVFLQFAVAASVCATPPFVATYDRFGQNADLALQPSAAHQLITELSCTACHASSDALLQPKRGPVLDGVGQRLHPDWVRQFLESPLTVKPGTTMPDMFAGWDAGEKRQAISGLVTFLMTQRQSIPELNSTAGNPIALRFWSKGDPAQGKEIYHSVGCVACHAPHSETANSELESLHSVPLPNLSAKYTAKSLSHFLIDPLATRPSGRMPSLKLRPEEAADIAAYLFGGNIPDSHSTGERPPDELVAAGRKLFHDLKCVNCHSVTGASEPLKSGDFGAADFVDLDFTAADGCLNGRRRGLPDFSLDDRQRTSLGQAISQRSVADPVHVRMMQLNCYACHDRKGLGGVTNDRRQFFHTVAQVDLGDEGRLPPPLDGVGRKLTSDWMKQVMAGVGDVRPHMTIRMPIFGKATDQLASSFATQDLADKKSKSLEQSDHDSEAGRTLMDQGCVQCHPIGGEKLPGVIGVDLSDLNQRVRPEWFREFLLDPAAIKPRTRMPTFFRNGKSSSPDILDGNVDRQIASLWKYLAESDKHPLPEKIQQGRAHDFELVPKEKPIVLRTFMDLAGPHAIAVGFPQGVHLAFDAEQVRIAQFWRGRFLDAHGTWFDRFTPPAKPLGSNIVDLFDPPNQTNQPDQTNPVDRIFRGYRLDADGIPTFLFQTGQVDIEDRYTTTDKKGFRRTLRLSLVGGQSESVTLSLLPIAGTNLKRYSDHEYRSASGLTVRWVTDKDSTEWSIPVDLAQPTEVVLEYQW